MNFLQRLKFAWQSFRTIGGIEIPGDTGNFGRSSEENFGGLLNSSLSKYQTVNPIIDFTMLALLKKFYIFNPDVSQFVDNLQNLANNGHQISVKAKSESNAESALTRLNESASRLYQNGAGVDGLINAYLAQIAWSGALSSEDVVNFGGRRIEQVVLVPVESIRFKYDQILLNYLPYQRTRNLTQTNLNNFGLIPLSSETYRYLALQTVENLPYAKPPATAAVDAILQGQEPMMKNIQYIAQKFGLLGLVTASVQPPPKKPNETESEYQGRAKSYLSLVAKALEGQFSKGLLVAFRDQKIEHTNIAEGASGVYDLNRISEEQVMSGLGMQPAFFGRTDSTTETFADVVYNLLMAKVHNIQRLPKRRMEQTSRLDLRLGGIEVDGVSYNFNKAFSRNSLQNAQTEEIELRNVLQKVKAGAISPDMAAQELGYESWFDIELLQTDASLKQSLMAIRKHQPANVFRFSFSKFSQKYSFVRETIEVLSEEKPLADNVLQIKKKALQRVLN